MSFWETLGEVVQDNPTVDPYGIVAILTAKAKPTPVVKNNTSVNTQTTNSKCTEHTVDELIEIKEVKKRSPKHPKRSRKKNRAALWEEDDMDKSHKERDNALRKGRKMKAQLMGVYLDGEYQPF